MMLPALLRALCLGVFLGMAEPLPEFDQLWDFAHPGKSETAFLALLPQAREAGDRGALVELLTQIARSQGLQRKFPEAHRTLDEAEQLLTPETTVARVRCLLERGRVFNSGGQGEKARPLFLEAWEAARAGGAEDYAVDAAHMLGIVEPPDKALEWNHRAIAEAEASQNPRVRRWLGPLYNNTGWTYYDEGQYREALDLLEKAERFYLERGTPEQVRIARYSVGKTHRALGKVEQALAIQEALRGEMERLREPDGYVYEEVAECLLLLDRAMEARPHFARAYDLLSKDDYLVEKEPQRLMRLQELGGR